MPKLFFAKCEPRRAGTATLSPKSGLRVSIRDNSSLSQNLLNRFRKIEQPLNVESGSINAPILHSGIPHANPSFRRIGGVSPKVRHIAFGLALSGSKLFCAGLPVFVRRKLYQGRCAPRTVACTDQLWWIWFVQRMG